MSNLSFARTIVLCILAFRKDAFSRQKGIAADPRDGALQHDK
jgi:hypothetical protein